MTDTGQDIPTNADDEFVAGDTAVVKDTITTGDGSAKPIDGATVTFALAEYRGASPIVEKDSGGSEVTITDAQNGEVSIEVTSTDTEGMGSPDGEEYHYEIEVEDSNGDVATVTTGTWTIHAETV